MTGRIFFESFSFFELIIFLKSNVKDIIILKKKQQKNEQRKEQNKKETKVKKAPKTGDVSVMPFCVLIPVASVGILSVVFFGRDRRRL